MGGRWETGQRAEGKHGGRDGVSEQGRIKGGRGRREKGRKG